MPRPIITARWYRKAVSRHDSDLSKPQRFPLTGDAKYTKRLTNRWTGSADQLATARYRDWKAGKE